MIAICGFRLPFSFGLARWPALALALAALLAATLPLQAQSRTSRGSPMSRAETANHGTVGIITGGADGTYIRIAADLANVLDGDDLRILPMIGRGSLQNLKDIMYLRGVDIGIVQMDAREGLKAEQLQDEAIQKLRYIARLYNEEVHILASKDITDIHQLTGKKVNIDKPGSGTNLTAHVIFDRLGIKPDYTTYDQALSYERLKSGEIQAAIYVAGRPVRAITEFKSDGKFHLLAIPFAGPLAEIYLPSKFTSADYPRLVDAGQSVDTLAVGSILAVFNWPVNSDRYHRVARFVDAFFSRFDEFTKPGHHPKWREVNLSADVTGWQRFKPAQDWLDTDREKTAAGITANDFQAFMKANGLQISAAENERLFRNFLAWQKEREHTRNRATR